MLWAGRTGDNFSAEPDPGLLELTVEQVVAAARAALDEPAQAARRSATVAAGGEVMLLPSLEDRSTSALRCPPT